MKLIDADKLKAKVRAQEWKRDPTIMLALNWIYMLIDNSPTIDAVPVVRCKDCKQYNTTGCSKGFGWCESMDRGVSDDFYCSCGEKKDKEESQ